MRREDVQSGSQVHGEIQGLPQPAYELLSPEEALRFASRTRGAKTTEYSLGGRRADYALCHPPREPVILVEVKQVGQSKGADRQLFQYAFHKGVPMAVLTDGQEWHFFLPTEQGDYGERRVYKLDLLERDPQEAEEGFERYLGYEEVRSGRAIEAARRDYRNAARKRTAQRTLPDGLGQVGRV